MKEEKKSIRVSRETHARILEEMDLRGHALSTLDEFIVYMLNRLPKLEIKK